MIDDINAEPDYGDEPPLACSSRVFLGHDSFACGGTPGHAGKHDYRLPWATIEWDGHAERSAVAAEPRPAPELAAATESPAMRDHVCGLCREAFRSADDPGALCPTCRAYFSHAEDVRRVAGELREARALLATVLGEFKLSGDGCHARVSQVTLAKRKQAAQMAITDAERKMIGG